MDMNIIKKYLFNIKVASWESLYYNHMKQNRKTNK